MSSIGAVKAVIDLWPIIKEQALVYAFIVVLAGSMQLYNERTFVKIDAFQALSIKMDSNYLEKSIEDNQRELWALMDKDAEGELTANERARLRVLQSVIANQQTQLHELLKLINQHGGRYEF